MLAGDIPTRARTLDEYLDDVSYANLNDESYVPSQFSLMFLNFIKLVNGETGEANITPPFHLSMFDRMTTKQRQFIANLVFRGGAKTTVWAEYLFLFQGVFHFLPGLPDITGAIYIGDSMENGCKSLRNNIEFRYDNSPFLQEWIPKAIFTDAKITFINKAGHKFAVRLFGAKTGLRGTKIFGKRPTLCVMDDLISDDDAKSKAAMLAIKDTVYKGVDYAMDPNHKKVIFNGTPFNSDDIMIEAIESGAWEVNVWPVCERFPCTEEEFSGAWEDRFGYEVVKEAYDRAVLNGQVSGFMQELMLRITSTEDRLVQDAEIRWYRRRDLLKNKEFYNFYITTDFATSEKQTADYTVISVWAYNANGDWFWVDGVCVRQTMEKTVDDLFRLNQEYKPQHVGIEVSGQQGGYIPWLQKEMLTRNQWFNFATDKHGQPGIRSQADKLSRFNMVVPWFKMGKVWFPEEMRESDIILIGIGQIRLVTGSGIKGKDDFIDTISMLGFLSPWKPAEAVPETGSQAGSPWYQANHIEPTGLSSYIV